MPPVAQRMPTPQPKRRRNQPLMDAIIGTMVMEAVNDIRKL